MKRTPSKLLNTHDLTTLGGALWAMLVSRLRIPADAATALIGLIFAAMAGGHQAITRRHRKQNHGAAHHSAEPHPTHRPHSQRKP